jgi:predicted SAM-dependent methyltransferase
VDGLYIQYGCGACAPDGWLNFDASPRLRLERLPLVGELLCAGAGRTFPRTVRPGNIVRGLPVADGSARGVYCSHVLEHVARDDLPRALANTLRMLGPGGRFRLVVPDLHWRVARYLEAADKADPAAADILLQTCRLGTQVKATRPMAIVRGMLGHGAHLWMYDFAGLAALLAAAGFAGVRRCEIGDSADPMFSLVEEEVRFFTDGRRELAIEAVRPEPASR